MGRATFFSSLGYVAFSQAKCTKEVCVVQINMESF